jgi:hypothetical protein
LEYGDDVSDELAVRANSQLTSHLDEEGLACSEELSGAREALPSEATRGE